MKEQAWGKTSVSVAAPVMGGIPPRKVQPRTVDLRDRSGMHIGGVCHLRS